MVRAPARLTRVGVFEYLQADGSIVRELRLPEEVFAPESLKSFELVPLTNDHPSDGTGAVTPDNATRLTVGAVGNVRKDSEMPDHVAADLAIFDGTSAAAVDAGKRELSCGYFCDREPAKPGATWADPTRDGLRVPYDFVQRNIRGNHVAIVDRGRAGPEARIKLDAGDAVQVTTSGTNPTPQERDRKQTNMEKITVDGITYEVSPQAAQAFAKMTANLDKANARADGAISQVEKLTADLKAAQDPQTIAAAVQTRVSLEATAKSLGVTVDGLSNDQVRKAVITKLSPGLNLDGRSADYTVGLFEALTEKSVFSKLSSGSVETGKIPNATTDDSASKSTKVRETYRTEFFKPLASK